MHASHWFFCSFDETILPVTTLIISEDTLKVTDSELHSFIFSQTVNDIHLLLHTLSEDASTRPLPC